jgi:hypothetical protein
MYTTVELFTVVVTPSPPVISNITPSAGTTITVATPIEFDITDTEGFTRIIVEASFVGTVEVENVHNGTTFSSLYVAGSTRTVIDNGFHYSLVRNPQWPGNITLNTYAVDIQGTEI